MAVENIGFSSVDWNVLNADEASVRESSEPRNIFLVWGTMDGSDVHKAFDVSIRFRGYKKGENQSSLSWSNWYQKEIPVGLCKEHTSQYKSGTYWAIGLSKLDGLFPQLTNDTVNDQFSFNNRIYDCLDIEVAIGVRMKAAPDWNGGSDYIAPEYKRLQIFYVPEYKFTKIYYEEPELVVIEYTDGGWTRTDDRFSVEGIKSTQDVWYKMPNLVKTDDYWGVVPKPGRIEIPTSMLRQHIKNMSVRVKVRFVASFRPPGSTFNGFSEVGVVEDETVCNTPVITLSSGPNPNYVYIKVSDSNDKNAPMETCSIKLTDGKYSVDEVLVRKNGTFPTAEFKYPPLNKEIGFIAIGGKGKATSAPVSLKVPAIKVGNETLLDIIDKEENFQLKMKYNPSFSIKGGSEKEIQKLAGRRRPSSFYGVGGETSISLKAEILNETGDDFLALQEIPRDVMVRFPDGKRFAIAVEDVSLGWENRMFKEVAIDGTEVDA